MPESSDASGTEPTPSDSSNGEGLSQAGLLSSSRIPAPVMIADAESLTSLSAIEATIALAGEGQQLKGSRSRRHPELTEAMIEELQDDPDSGAESDEGLAFKLERAYARDKYPWWERELEERKSKSKRLAIQSNLHTQLVEDRLKFLEREVRGLLKLPPTDENDTEKDANINKPLPHHRSIKHMGWTAFSAPVLIPTSLIDRTKWIHGMEVDGTIKNVVEILIEEPQRGNRSLLFQTFIPGLITGNYDEAAPNIDPANYVPWRIRLRSPLMLKLLERVTGQKVTIGVHKHQLVLLRPFKLLVAYRDKIFEFLKEIEEKIAAKSSEESKELEDETKKQDAENKAEEAKKEEDANQEDATKKEEDPTAELESPDALEHMKLLKELLDTDLDRTVQLREGIETGKSKMVAFGDLWHVFRYGQEVRSAGPKHVQLYRVLKMTGGRDVVSRAYVRDRDLPSGIACVKYKDEGYTKDAFVLDCVYFEFDGNQFGPISKSFIIRKFEGEKPITSLPIYPLNLDPRSGQLRKEILERGKRYAHLSNPSQTAHRQYQGLTLDHQPEQIESQIIIDFKLSFLEVQEWQPLILPISLVQHDTRETELEYDYKCERCTDQGCCGNDIIFPDYEVDQYFEDILAQETKNFLDAIQDAKDLEDDQKVLLPCKVYGFALRSRKWATFDIDLVKEVEYAHGWDNLVLNPTVKDTVLALVKNHARVPDTGLPTRPLEGALSSVDLVRGKGKGLIILLHGEPGVGKTSTAECVADHTRRPLFPITCGDIGDTAESVESNLERNFQLAHKWGCVLLLDEADVFLSRRTSSDLTRNAIVSVFLRTLEYYSGILFLTTNRVGNIDRAFKSRIHVALYYPKLDKDSTYQIWKKNIKRIKADFKREKKDFAIEEKEILLYSKKHFKELKKEHFLNWNGRQIRNAFQTAIALAEYDAGGNVPVLKRSHFEKVAAASKDFDQYLKDTQRGKDDAQLAREEKIRDDTWGDYVHNPRAAIDEGIQWTPPAPRAARGKPAIQPLQRRDSAQVGKKKSRHEVTDETDETSVTSSETDVSASESEAESEPKAEKSDKEGDERSSEEEKEKKKKRQAPVAPSKPAKTKTKAKASGKGKASSSKKAQSSESEAESEDADKKPKRKSKASTSKKVDHADSDEESTEGLEIKAKKKHKGSTAQAKETIISEEEESEEEEVEPPPQKKRSAKSSSSKGR